MATRYLNYFAFDLKSKKREIIGWVSFNLSMYLSINMIWYSLIVK
jgi:hypothetical protein